MGIIVSGIKFIFIDIIFDFIYWPIWWYTIGFKDRLFFCWLQIKKTWINLGLSIWLRHIFTPMYGDRSIIGRLISFAVRLVILCWRLFWFLIWSLLVLVSLIIWLLGPVAVGWMIFRHF